MEKPNAVKERWKEIEEIIDNDPTFNIYQDFNSSESPERPSFSLGISQDSKSPTSPRNPTEEILNIPPVRHILPIENPIAMMLSKGLSEAETKKIYSWVMKSSRQESVRRETIASFKGKFEFSLSTDDMMRLKPREWISNNYLWEIIINTKNVGMYIRQHIEVGIGPHFGSNKRFFDKKEAAKKEWWFVPTCNRAHWYLYALHIPTKNLFVLDSMHDEPFDDLRKIIDNYVSKIIKEMLKITVPKSDFEGYGKSCQYVTVPKQPNNNDCGLFVILFMQEWNGRSLLKDYDNETLAKLRRQLVMDIVLTPFNTKRDDVLKIIFPHLQGRSIPKRGKKKKVESPYIAPNTRKITRRAEEGKGFGRGKNNEKGK
ncbi:hypothetical protein PIB30_069215 [Stylosanthes scabra]|uniref:Ubiquitin-like protease family profile domain-containing protein n=1 Tax=Stylosanthes scabra TaxID=79078 RepID=A0ABU6VMR3_9FABA|nr:hypothetical protein [Stylosanthes scabra]